MGTTQAWPRCGCEMSPLFSLMMMLWTSLCVLWYLKKGSWILPWISDSIPSQENLSVFPGELYRIEGRAGKKSFRRPFPTERSIRMCFAGLKDSDFVMDYHTLINSSTLLMYPPRMKGLRNVKCALISIKAGKAGKDTLPKLISLVSFPLRHFVMWNIAPLHHMPQQISWGTIPMTVVVNSMKASHKTAPSSWCDRNIL